MGKRENDNIKYIVRTEKGKLFPNTLNTTYRFNQKSFDWEGNGKTEYRIYAVKGLFGKDEEHIKIFSECLLPKNVRIIDGIDAKEINRIEEEIKKLKEKKMVVIETSNLRMITEEEIETLRERNPFKKVNDNEN